MTSIYGRVDLECSSVGMVAVDNDIAALLHDIKTAKNQPIIHPGKLNKTDYADARLIDDKTI